MAKKMFEVEIRNNGPKGYETAVSLRMPATWSEFHDALQKARIKDGRSCGNELLYVGYDGLQRGMIGRNINLYDLNLLAQRLTLLNASQAVVLDTNIPAESIEWLADHCAAPLFADPVSTAKAVKLKPVLGKLHTLKPNRIEAELLSGVKITDDASLQKAAETLLDTGLHRVFISLGSDGVFAADRSGQQVQLPPLPGAMVNTTGCGDAFMAAITWAYLQGTDLTDTAKAGLAASVIAMESAETINPAMSEDTLRQRAALSN